MAKSLVSTEPYAAQFEALQAALPEGPLDERRLQALARFRELGFPTTRQESWKYTALRSLAGLTPAAATEAPSLDRAPALLADTPAHRLVFVNGLFRTELSDLGDLPQGAFIASLTEALDDETLISEDEDGAFALLNQALFQDGALIALDRGVVLDQPIILTFVSIDEAEGRSSHPRLAIRLGENSQATVIEHHLGYGEALGLSNLVSSVDLAAGAKLDHVVLQTEQAQVQHIATRRVTVGRDATYDSFGVTLGAGLSRNEIEVSLEGTGASCALDGTYLLAGTQHGDLTSTIHHRAEHTTSRETVKGALAGKARGVFQGKIVVEPGAQKTDGRMMNKTLLLSDKAEIDSKPELEIFADDVQCAHGATAGELDADALFYLRARGIPEEQARALLVEAFLADVIELCPVEALREELRGRAGRWLAEASQEEAAA